MNRCTLTVKKVSVRLFRGVLDRMFDELITEVSMLPPAHRRLRRQAGYRARNSSAPMIHPPAERRRYCRSRRFINEQQDGCLNQAVATGGLDLLSEFARLRMIPGPDFTLHRPKDRPGKYVRQSFFKRRDVERFADDVFAADFLSNLQPSMTRHH